MGKIRNEDGTAAKGVSVQLIPVSFSPLNALDSSKIDSIQTDDKGRYFFNLKASGIFNLSAQSNGACSYKDSIFADKNNKTTLPDDTLREPGSLTGTVQLRPSDDNRKTFILVLGTYTFTQPKDSSGHFSIPALAQGNYKVQILTSLPDYTLFDTSITIESGKNTAIPGILQLKYEGVPSISKVTAQYNQRLMLVTLTWPACDTSRISSYYIFRNSDISKTPLVIVNKTDTEYVDDVASLNSDSLIYANDTLHYAVAALGKNITLGKAGVAPEIIRQSVVTLQGKIAIPDLYPYGLNDVSIDNSNNIYIAGYGPTIKLDPTGQIIARCADSLDSGVVLKSGRLIMANSQGDVYILDTNQSSMALTRLTSDLKFVSKFTLADAYSPYAGTCMGLNQNGMVCLISSDSTQQTKATLFDSSLSVVRSDSMSIFSFWTSLQMINDTIFTFSSVGFKAFGTNFIELHNWDVNTVIRKYSPAGALDDPTDFRVSPAGAYAFCIPANSSYAFGPFGFTYGKIIFLFDSNKNLIKRFALPGWIAGFDSAGRLYWNYGDGFIYILNVN
jgi:hypothetical protein